MPKDVDLSSKEWCDLVFEGKNKDFGAYQLRTNSVKRHNKAVIYTLVGLVIVGVAIFSTLKIQQIIAERPPTATLCRQPVNKAGWCILYRAVPYCIAA